MRIAYVCGTLQKGQDGVSRVLYRTIQGTLARNFEVMAIGAALPAVATRNGLTSAARIGAPRRLARRRSLIRRIPL